MIAMETKPRSKKPLTNFNEFWTAMKQEQSRQGLRKVEWMKKSGISYQRYSEFESGLRDISARYLIKLIGGLNVKTEHAERTLNRKFTEEQKRMLKFEANVDANREWLELLLNDPEKMKICKAIATSKG
jgi:transcriptional regulator with XRE-family HTH domain